MTWREETLTQLHFGNSQGLSSNWLFKKKYKQQTTNNKQPKTPQVAVRGIN